MSDLDSLHQAPEAHTQEEQYARLRHAGQIAARWAEALGQAAEQGEAGMPAMGVLASQVLGMSSNISTPLPRFAHPAENYDRYSLERLRILLTERDARIAQLETENKQMYHQHRRFQERFKKASQLFSSFVDEEPDSGPIKEEKQPEGVMGISLKDLRLPEPLYLGLRAKEINTIGDLIASNYESFFRGTKPYLEELRSKLNELGVTLE